MPIEISKSRRKDYLLFHLDGDVDTQACFELKSMVFETIQGGHNDICFDLSKAYQLPLFFPDKFFRHFNGFRSSDENRCALIFTLRVDIENSLPSSRSGTTSLFNQESHGI